MRMMKESKNDLKNHPLTPFTPFTLFTQSPNEKERFGVWGLGFEKGLGYWGQVAGKLGIRNWDYFKTFPSREGLGVGF